MNSLINTFYPDFEVITVDNGSTDGSIQYLKEHHGNIRIIELRQNKGFAEGANIGAKEATGAILAFINNDMEVLGDWLINAVGKLVSSSSAAAVQCKILTYNNRKMIDSIGLSVDRYNIASMIGRHEIDRGQYDSLTEIGACSGGAMIIWKEIFHDVGAFDPIYFMYYEDVDLSWRLKLRGFKILPAPSSVIYHVGSATSKTSGVSDELNLTPFFGFHTTKNYVYCWLKNSSLKALVIYWPMILLIVLAKISSEILKGKARVALSQTRGVLWNLMHLKVIVKKRRETRRLGKIHGDDILLATEIHSSSHLHNWIRNGLRGTKNSNVH